MDIGHRLRELRLAKALTQGDIQRLTGKACSHISRIENGHILPSLETLEKWTKALDVEMYELFYAGQGKPEASRVTTSTPLAPDQEAREKVFDRQTETDQRSTLEMARKMAMMAGGKGVSGRGR